MQPCKQPPAPEPPVVTVPTAPRTPNDTALLTPQQRGAIGDSLRRCLPHDPTLPPHIWVVAIVTTDANGVAKQATLTPESLALANTDPALRRFALRATTAILSPECRHLPLPPELGKPRTFLPLLAVRLPYASPSRLPNAFVMYDATLRADAGLLLSSARKPASAAGR